MNSIHQRQRIIQANILEKNKKYLSKNYVYDHVERSLTCNILLLMVLYGLSMIFQTTYMESLICLDLIAIIFHGIICYRKHTAQ